MDLHKYSRRSLPRQITFKPPPDMSRLERFVEGFFWVSVTVGLLVPLYLICINLYEKFRDSSMAFTIDSSYLDFNTSFPSISLCQVFNGEKNWDLSERYFGDERDKRIDDFLTEISFFTGACYTCELCDVEVSCPNNFTDILGKFRANCLHFLKNCSWNGVPFECCEGFRPLATETGTCYTINSALTHPMYGKELFCNRENGPGKLRMMVTEDIQVFIHHPVWTFIHWRNYVLKFYSFRTTFLLHTEKEIFATQSFGDPPRTLSSKSLKLSTTTRCRRFQWANGAAGSRGKMNTTRSTTSTASQHARPTATTRLKSTSATAPIIWCRVKIVWGFQSATLRDSFAWPKTSWKSQKFVKPARRASRHVKSTSIGSFTTLTKKWETKKERTSAYQWLHCRLM